MSWQDFVIGLVGVGLMLSLVLSGLWLVLSGLWLVMRWPADEDSSDGHRPPLQEEKKNWRIKEELERIRKGGGE